MLCFFGSSESANPSGGCCQRDFGNRTAKNREEKIETLIYAGAGTDSCSEPVFWGAVQCRETFVMLTA